MGDREGTHILLVLSVQNTNRYWGVNKFAKWSMPFPCKIEVLGRRLVCVRVCVDIWERMVVYSAEWIIL